MTPFAANEYVTSLPVTHLLNPYNAVAPLTVFNNELANTSWVLQPAATPYFSATPNGQNVNKYILLQPDPVQRININEIYPIYTDNTAAFFGPMTQEVKHPLAANLTVIIDGKEAKLNDLPLNIQVRLVLDKNNVVTRIEAEGGTLDNCIVDSLDPIKHTLAVSQNNQQSRYPLADRVEVQINGHTSSLAGLKPEMPVSLRMSAVKNAVIGIRSVGPLVDCVLRDVDADGRTITITLKKQHLTIAHLAVAGDAPITVHGHAVRLVDLQSRLGKPVVVRMDADQERNRVVEITLDEGNR
jgi:hypothetical protein